jgi:hypothetical protein
LRLAQTMAGRAISMPGLWRGAGEGASSSLADCARRS